MTEVAADRAVTLDSEALDQALESHRIELTAYCYRMLGSAFEAEDAVQDTLVRAWKGFDRFEGRSSLRSWLYRIATNVCLDMLDGQPAPRPADGPRPGRRRPTPASSPLPEVDLDPAGPRRPGRPGRRRPGRGRRARESVRLAFVAALQHLPPRQRAVLILREVLQWQAAEVAELLDTSVASVNSALQRARATLGPHDVERDRRVAAARRGGPRLLARYVEAFERYDMDALTSLLHEDATWSMPPYDLWLQTHEDIRSGASARASAARARA